MWLTGPASDELHVIKISQINVTCETRVRLCRRPTRSIDQIKQTAKYVNKYIEISLEYRLIESGSSWVLLMQEAKKARKVQMTKEKNWLEK